MAERGDLDKRGISKPASERYIFVIWVLVLIFVLFFLCFGVVKLVKNKFIYELPTCGDGTFYDTCSLKKPYYCIEGELIMDSSLCGCPEGISNKDPDCVTVYSTGQKTVDLKYTFYGQEKHIGFDVYEGAYRYFSGLPRSIHYTENQISSRADFKLKNINNDAQEFYLLPLVAEIQNAAPKSIEDQFRIAISIVQNIPYGNTDKKVNFGGDSFDYERYPYEVIYENEGICGEKTALLAFLLRELGYSTALFYYPDENHEALGVKCPVDKGVGNTGYCFIETTAPSIITESEIFYLNVGKLVSSPQISLLSTGFSLDKKMMEYRDARKMNRIRNGLEDGRLNPLRHLIYIKLKEKYGLAEGYYSG